MNRIKEVLEDNHIEKVMKIFDSKENVAHIVVSIDNNKIAENDYNLSVSSYIEAKDNREQVNIAELNNEIAKTVEKINKLRADIDVIINDEKTECY